MEWVAVDLSASNGRTMLDWFNGDRMALEELNRFENNYVQVGDAYFWGILSLYTCIVEGLR